MLFAAFVGLLNKLSDLDKISYSLWSHICVHNTAYHIIYHLRIGYSYNKHCIYICYFDHCTPSTCPLGSVNWPMKKRSGSLKAGVYGGGFISASSVLFQIWMVGQFTGNPFKYYETPKITTFTLLISETMAFSRVPLKPVWCLGRTIPVQCPGSMSINDFSTLINYMWHINQLPEG